MDDQKYCRVCLVTDVKMFNLETTTSTSIGVVYSHLAQIPIFDGNQYVCFECASLLHKFQEFKSKCLRANNILSRFEVGSTQATKSSIKNVDRKINKLESTLKISCVEMCVCTSYEDPANYIEIEINKVEENEVKPSDICVKIEEDNKTEIDKIPDFDGGHNDTDDDYNLSSEETTSVNIVSSNPPKRKRKVNTQTKTSKKRKIKSENDFDDDKPLSKSVTKKVASAKPTKKVAASKPIKKVAAAKPVKKVASTSPISVKKVGSSKSTEKDETEKASKKKDGVDIAFFDNYATVEFLTHEDARKEVLLRRESTNYKVSPFKCDLCYRGFEAKSAFENHMKRHKTEFGDHECEVCHLRFPTQVKLCKHRLSCHKRKFSCKLCSYVCYCIYQAKTHVSLHKGTKYPCKHCGELFSMPNSLLMHMRMKHLKESVRESVCEMCGSTFRTPHGLYLHNMKVHRQEKNEKLGPKCDDCGVHFASELAWKRHLVIATKHKVSNGCKFCGETFANEDDLKTHLKVHSRKQINRNLTKLPGPCAICHKWVENRAEYKAHMTSEHPQCDEAKKFHQEDQTPFVCEVCGKMFKKQCFLTYHQRKHTGERPYKCPVCDKAFQLAGALTIHRAVHERTRTHKCHVCERVFTFRTTLNKHMKIHLGIRPHKCTLCEKGFIHLCDLKLHIKYVHDKVPWPKKKNKRNVDDTAYLDYN